MDEIHDRCLAAREKLIADIRKEMLGPGSENSVPDSEHEIITDLPEVRYSTGILFPQRNQMNVDNDETIDPRITDSDENESDVDEKNASDQPDFLDVPTEHAYVGNIGDDSDVIDTQDEEMGLANQNMPSSMGMTFFVRGKVTTLNFQISFGTYRKTTYTDCCIKYDGPQTAESIEIGPAGGYVFLQDGFLKLKTRLEKRDVWKLKEIDQIDDNRFFDVLFKLAAQCGRRGFIREPHLVNVKVLFSQGDYDDSNVSLAGKNVKLTVLKRNCGNDVFAITAMLVNTAIGFYNGENSIFQPKICIASKENPELIFEQYTKSLFGMKSDEEEKSLALLYRNKKIYATGHGAAVEWTIDNDGQGEIWTEFMPASVVPQLDFDLPNNNIPPKSLSMKFLSDLDETNREVKIDLLTQFVKEYHCWVDEMTHTVPNLSVEYRDTAYRHVQDCRESYERMYRGIEILLKNDIAYNSFLLANRSMFMQRIHSDIQKTDRYPNDQEISDRLQNLDYRSENDKHHWRPFQLAFLLLSIVSIVECDSDDRELVDLIWFPTGGGKTEAYLGLTAFTIFFRRLQYKDISKGTAVMMRYTLRLLAAQQFIRASTLICACEMIRRENRYHLGSEPITIGLWIGGTHTPNRNEGRDSAKEHVDELLKVTVDNIKYTIDKHNKFQILKCPWCGTKLVRDVDTTKRPHQLRGNWGYKMREGKHFYLACPQEGCQFSKKLPIQVVDEELYDSPPTLLFGTVDKFAMMAWKSRAGDFFATNTNARAPELIIQDELHLISGPLGTLVGLYETAIDSLCSAKGVRPKIIASTATIRRAKNQCRHLYNREVRQFPSPGIDAGDSFFAREADIKVKPGRLYIGVMPSGKTKAMMEVRMAAALLQYVHLLEFEPEVKDKFWTLAVYFNSLRDLGKCCSLVDDDVKDFMDRIANRLGTRKMRRIISSAYELTSRVSTTQINETLERLENLVYSDENIKNKRYAINVLLASNMISVGVDIARLNLMLIVGQPKLTSEYIQVSSRIGRTYPGMAFTLYDGAKSRDRSHYEQFKSYHDSFYRYVEPTSVTPFSKPARDRALHAVLVSMLRHGYDMPNDTDASKFPPDRAILNEIENIVLGRVESIRRNVDLDMKSESEEILAEIREFWSEWENRKNISGYKFLFGEKSMMTGPGLDEKRLMKPYGTYGSDIARETPTSMRNVDHSAAAKLIIWGDEH